MKLYCVRHDCLDSDSNERIIISDHYVLATKKPTKAKVIKALGIELVVGDRIEIWREESTVIELMCKVKDYIGWLLVWNTGNSWRLATEHYFGDKKKSLCGVRKHPRTQPEAAFVPSHKCKTCERLRSSRGLP